MRFVFPLFPLTLFVGFAMGIAPVRLSAQLPAPNAAAEMPDTPRLQAEMASLAPLDQQGAAATGTSTSREVVQQPASEKTQQAQAAQQIKQEEKQRILGILPSFNTSYRSDALTLTGEQKIGLAFRSAIDPVAFGKAFLVAGFHEANHDDIGFPWGFKGYAERSGAAYLDSFTSGMVGSGFLPAALHQDPRYFRLGHGSILRRVGYAFMTTVVCKHDTNRRWEPNVSNVGGNIVSSAFSTLYYPDNNSGAGDILTRGLTRTATGGIGSLFDEFWPDVSRKFFHKDPTHGLDDQARAADTAKKQAKQ